MRFLSGLRSGLIALIAIVAAAGILSAAHADSGTIRISFVKAGWIIGGSAGSGTLTFRGRNYPLAIGGLSYGFTFGGSQTNLVGTVTNIFRPSDVAGVYGAAGAGAAEGSVVGVGATKAAGGETGAGADPPFGSMG